MIVDNVDGEPHVDRLSQAQRVLAYHPRVLGRDRLVRLGGRGFDGRLGGRLGERAVEAGQLLAFERKGLAVLLGHRAVQGVDPGVSLAALVQPLLHVAFERVDDLRDQLECGRAVRLGRHELRLHVGGGQLDGLRGVAAVGLLDGDGERRAVQRVDVILVAGDRAGVLVRPQPEAVVGQARAGLVVHGQIDGASQPLVALDAYGLVVGLLAFAEGADGLYQVVGAEECPFADGCRAPLLRFGPAIGVARRLELIVGVAVQLAFVDVRLHAHNVVALDAEHATGVHAFFGVAVVGRHAEQDVGLEQDAPVLAHGQQRVARGAVGVDGEAQGPRVLGEAGNGQRQPDEDGE